MRGRQPGRWLVPIGSMAIVAGAIIAFYLWTYPAHHFAVPLGWDSPGYAWRTVLARASGVPHLPSSIPPPGPVNPGRPGFVVLGALLASLAHVEPLRLTEALPAVSAMTIGLAAGAFVSATLRRSWWQAAFTSAAVGTSVFVVHTINVEAYQDNAMAVAFLTAAATPVVLCLRERRAVLPAALLIGACGAVHWNLFEVGAAILLLFLAVYLPTSLRRWRAGESIVQTPAGRLAGAAAGGSALAAGSILGILSAPLPSADLVAGQFVNKFYRDIPQYHLALTLPVAAGGALSLAGAASEESDAGERSRGALAFLLAWCEVTVVGFLAERVLNRAVPTHRLLADTIALPILAALAVLWLASWAWARGRGWRPVAVVVAAGALAISATVAHGQWFQFSPVMRETVLAQASTAERYLNDAGLGVNRPVVFIVDSTRPDPWSDAWLTGHTIRAGLDANRIPHAFVYFGTPDGYLGRRPTQAPAAVAGSSPGAGSRYALVSDYYLRGVLGTYGRDPVAIVLSAADSGYGRWARANPSSVVAPGVGVVRGGVPGTRSAFVSPVSPLRSSSVAGLAALALGLVGLLVATGGGWTWTLLGGWLGTVEVAALTPAFGLAVTVLGGVALNAAGVPFGAAGSVAMVALIGGSGWTLALLLHFRRGRAVSERSPSEE